MANIDTSTGNPFKNLPSPIVWVALAVPLLFMANYDTTSRLAAALAYLILIAVVMAYGQQALLNVNVMLHGKGALPNPPTRGK